MRSIVMTGASRGIGRAAAGHLLRVDPEVHLIVIGRGGDGPGATRVEADLADLSSVRAAGEHVRELAGHGKVPPLAAFAGNAGVQYTDALTTAPGGLEASFVVNVLANHLLVRLLEETLTPSARIVLTTSDTHFGDLRHDLGMVPGPRWRSPETLARPGAFRRPHTTRAGRAACSTGKLGVLYLVHEHARRLPREIAAIAYNPGFVPGTGLARHGGPAARLAMRRLLPVLTATPFASGIDITGRRLADIVLGRIPAPSGSYVDRDRVAPSSPESYDPARERDLWETAERLTAPGG